MCAKHEIRVFLAAFLTSANQIIEHFSEIIYMSQKLKHIAVRKKIGSRVSYKLVCKVQKKISLAYEWKVVHETIKGKRPT